MVISLWLANAASSWKGYGSALAEPQNWPWREPNGPCLAPAPTEEDPWSLLLDCSPGAGAHKQVLFLFFSDCFILTFKPLTHFQPNLFYVWRFQGQVAQDMAAEGGESSQLMAH